MLKMAAWFLQSIILTSGNFSLKTESSNEDKQQTVGSVLPDPTRHIKSVLPKAFVAEMKVYSLRSTVLQQGEDKIFTSSKKCLLC